MPASEDAVVREWLVGGERGGVVAQDLGRIGYERAFGVQRDRHERVLAARGRAESAGYLLLLEHDPPVITVSKRAGSREHLLATEEMLARAGVEVRETDRGGDITYHGPGQLVAYPIVDLNRLGLNLHGYMRLLESVVMDVCAAVGVRGRRDESATGVWVDQAGGAPARKVCAMGIRVRRWVTMHGLALNVSPDLGHFDLIVPCGLAGRGVTSLSRELGEGAPGVEEVKTLLAERFGASVEGVGRG